MLALRLPFSATSLSELAQQILHAELPPLHSRDAQLVQAVRMCAVREPANRASAAQLQKLPALQLAHRKRMRRFVYRRYPTGSAASPVLHLSPTTSQQLSRGEVRATYGAYGARGAYGTSITYATCASGNGTLHAIPTLRRSPRM